MLLLTYIYKSNNIYEDIIYILVLRIIDLSHFEIHFKVYPKSTVTSNYNVKEPRDMAYTFYGILQSKYKSNRCDSLL